MLSIRSVVVIFFDSLIFLSPSIVSGQNYPNKPMRILASEAGGPTDTTARVLAQGLSASWGQPVIVENHVNVVGYNVAKRARADGYTLLVAASSFLYGPLLKKTSYDPIRDFTPIVRVTSAPNIIFVYPALPVKSVKELIDLAKAKPGVLNYASTGIGSATNLSVELFKSMAGVNIVHIPYKGTPQAINDTVSGQSHMIFATAAAVGGYWTSGRLRALAVASAQPSALSPSLPTVTSSGLPGYESGTSSNAFAPVNTPELIINRLNQEIVRILSNPDVKERFLQVGQEVGSSSPEALARSIKSDIARISKVIQDAGIRVEE